MPSAIRVPEPWRPRRAAGTLLTNVALKGTLVMSRIALARFPIALAVFFALLPPLCAQPKAGRDWPTFRGNSLQSGVAEELLPDKLAVRWTFNAKTNIESSPIVVDGTVFFAAGNGKLYAHDLTTGKKKWDYPTPGILAVPAAREGAIYFGDAKGVFHCLDAVTGKRRWALETGGQISGPANFTGEKVLFGSDDCHLYCVSVAGKLLWKCETKEKIRSSPAVVDDRVLVGGCDHKLHVVDLASGNEVGAVPLGGHVAASPAIRGQYAYVGTMANQFLAVDWKKNAIHWQFEAKRAAQPFFASAAVTNEVIVAASRDKIVRGLNRDTGKELWAFPTKGRIDGSPVVAGKRVFVASHDGNLYVLDLARGTALTHFDLGGATSATPAIAGECVVITTILGDVICLGMKQK